MNYTRDNVFFAAFLLLFLLGNHVFCSYQERLKPIPTLQDPTHSLGFDNCNMQTNGEILAIKSLIKNHDIVFDVGANIGEWSTFVHNHAPQATIYAFEPLQPCYEQFRRNLSSPYIHTCHAALSNVKGQANLIYYPEISGLSTFYNRPILRNQFHLTGIVCKVATTTLDEFCEEHDIRHIDFLKIDTEGAETLVIAGAKSMIEHGNIGIIQFEYGGCYKDASTTLEYLYKYLTAKGYAIYRIHDNGIIPVHCWNDSLENFLYSNYLAVLQ